MGREAVERMIGAIGAGLPVLLPTDTVYGLAASAEREEYTAAVYRLKGRDAAQPTALVASSVRGLFECLPELDDDTRAIVDALLPGPYTLVVPNPARRYRWLTGERVDAIGVRVPQLTQEALEVLAEAGCVMATSANDPGGPSPARLEDVPSRIRNSVAAELDAGPLPGTASTVIDFTGAEPRVIRDGIASAAEAIAKVRPSH